MLKKLNGWTVAKFALVVLCLSTAPQIISRQESPPTINKTSISNGNILLNGEPFPMVLDAGTDTFTPQDYDTIMGNKDGFGANTWWLQYAMRHMKSETEGDFTGLEHTLDFFEKTGMWVNLYLRAEYRDLPDWFYQKYDDYQMLDPTGKPVGKQICLQHEGFRRLVDRFLHRAVAVSKNKRSLLMYSIYDEFCIRGWGCFCSRCVTGYRDYLQEKYGEVGKLNQTWKSRYGSWQQIDAPRTQSFDPNYGDWQRYRLKVLHDFGTLYYKAVKEEDPNHLVWIDINMDLYGYTWQRLCVWWKLTGIFDAFNLGPDAIAEGGTLRTAMNRAIRDNYGKGATWHRGIFDGEFMYKPEIYSLLFESNHGGLVWWYSYWDVLRTGQAWGAGQESETPIQANWFAARELNHLAQYLGDLYVYSKPVRGEVAVFVSALTDMMRSVTAKQVLQTEDALDLGGLGQILRDLNIPYEAIGEDQIKALDSFKAIVLGQFSMCSDDATAQAFREYVHKGGTLIVTNYAFSANANGLEVSNPGFGLDEVWGSAGRVNDQTEEGRILISQDFTSPLGSASGAENRGDSPFEGGRCEKIGCAAHPAAPSPLAPLPQMGAREDTSESPRGKGGLQGGVTPSPPLGERLAAGRVRGQDSIFSHLRGQGDVRGERRFKQPKGHPPTPAFIGGILKGMQLPTLGGVARRKVSTAQVIARLADGTPAITLNRYGQGQVLFIGTNAGEAYNAGTLLRMGKYRSDRKTPLTIQEYQKLMQRYEGWQNYAILLGGILKHTGVESPIVVRTADNQDLLTKVRVSLQQHLPPGGNSTNHLLVVTLDPIYDPLTQIQEGPKAAVKAQSRKLSNLVIRAKVPDLHRVKAVYRIPAVGDEMGRIEAIPEKVPFEILNGEIEIVLSEISEVACLVIARGAGPLVGIKANQIMAQEGKPTRVQVTVDNAAGTDISGEITFTPGFKLEPVSAANGPHFGGLRPGERHSAEFDVTAPWPIERNRTFQAMVRYRCADGQTGSARSYPVTSRTDERIASGWVKRVETDMAEAATPPTPWGDLYNEALQKRELVYAAYNGGAYTDAIRLAKEHAHLCTRIKEERKQPRLASEN